MVELRKVSRDFPTPKVRDSFTRQFFDVSATEEKLRSGGLWRHGGGLFFLKDLYLMLRILDFIG
jgi:hypothetical protein